MRRLWKATPERSRVTINTLVRRRAVVARLPPSQTAIAPPEMCNGLMIPIVVFDQIYSFDRDALIKALPAAKGAKGKGYDTAAGELFDRIMLLTDNAGSTDEHRALNYLAVRYPAVYDTVAPDVSFAFTMHKLRSTLKRKMSKLHEHIYMRRSRWERTCRLMNFRACLKQHWFCMKARM